MKVFYTLFLLFISFINLFSQNFEKDKLYFKVTQASSLELEFTNGELISNAENFYFKSLIEKYSIKKISKPFKAKDEKLQKTYSLEFDTPSKMEELLKDLESKTFIEYAEKIPLNELFYTPNDPMLGQQWNLNTIQAEQAWNISTGSNNVVVAVTDNAIQLNHEDLTNNIWVNPLEIAGNGLDDDNNGYIDDVNGWDAADNDNNPNPINLNNDHGTHVSGIVASTTDNTTGIASIGFNIKIMAVKIGTSPSGSLTGAYAGIDYVISTNQADVINMSWGGSGYSITNQNVINAAHNAGITLVAAAGNSNTSAPMYPASYNHVISVGATDLNDQRANFSNYGTNIDVMAPGKDILSCMANSTNNGYALLSGTSMASPLVAGLCGLLISHSPGITPTQIETCLENTCDNINAQNPSFTGQIGAGRINAFQALQCFNTPPTSDFTVDLNTPCTGQNIQFTDLSYGTTITTWLWDFGDGSATSNLQNPTHTYISNGSYTVSLTVSNAFGNDSEIKTNYVITTIPTATISGSSSIVSGGNAYLQVQFTGTPPFDFTYTDGTNNTNESGITNNPYYFSVSPLANTTYSLVSMNNSACSGSVSGSAIVEISLADTNNTTCNNGQYIMNDNGMTDARTIIHTDDGGFIVAGITTVSGAGQEDAFITKFDNQNNIEWSKTIGSSSRERGYPVNVIQTTDGYVVSLNSTLYGPLHGALVILKLDNNGNMIWQKKVDNSSGYSNSGGLHEDNQGNFILCGNKGFDSGNGDSYTIKVSSTGNLLWSNTISSSNTLNGCLQTSDNGYIFAGQSYTFGSGSASKLIVKLDQNGVFQWSKYLDNTNNEAFYDLDYTHDGNICLIGVEIYSSSNWRANLTKIDENGIIIWSKSYSGVGKTVANGIKILSNGNIFFSGNSNSFGNGNDDLYLTKLDPNGNEIWTKFYGGPQAENHYNTTHSISINELNNQLYLIGNTISFGGSDIDPYLIKTDLSGLTNCNITTANWTVNAENQTTGNGPFTTVPIGTISNSSLVLNSFIANLDTLCDAPCSTQNPTPTSCNNGQYIMNDNGMTDARTIIHTDDGGFIVAGITTVSGAGQEDAFITKFDNQNNIEWSKTIGTSSRERGYPVNVIQTTDGYVVSLNSTLYGPLHGALVILKLDNNGNMIWQKKVDNSSGYSNSGGLHEDNQGNFILCGNKGFDSGNGDSYTIKVSSTGNLLWSNTISSSNTLNGCLQTSDNGYIFAGQSYTFGSGSASKLIVKLDQNGVFQWSKYLDNTNNEAFYDLDYTHDGNICLIGVEIYSSSNWRANLTKIDENGIIIWSKSYSGVGKTVANGIKILSNGNIFFSGNSNSFGNGNDDLYLTKLDPNGNEIWTKFYGGPQAENHYNTTHSISINELNNQLYLIGNTISFGGSDIDPYLIKTDLSGLTNCNITTANWTVNAENQTTGNGPFTTVPIGTISNSSLVLSPFVANLDTLCDAPCSTPLIQPCENTRIDSAICFGDSIMIQLPIGTNYNWSPDYNISDNTISNPILFPEMDTTYIVYYINADSCSVIDTFNVIVNQNPEVIANSNDTTICPGNCVQLLANGAVNYVWSPTLNLSNPNISNPSACPLVSTEYIVEGNNNFGCSSKDTVTINVLNCCGAFANFIVSDSILCIGDNISISNESIINPPATHAWIFNGGTPNSFNGTNPPLISYSSAGVYTIQYIYQDACGIDTLEKTIFVFDLPLIETANDTTLCDSTTFNYDLGGIAIGGYTYNWTPSLGLNFTNISNPTATINSSIQYEITVVDEFSSCVNYDTVNITIENLPENFITSNSNSWCENDSLILSSSFVFDSIIWNNIFKSNSFEIELTSDTIIYAEGFLNNCSVLDTIDIIIDTLPNINILMNDTNLCLGESINIEIASSFPILWNTGETSNIINVAPIADSLFFATAQNGNCTISDSVEVIVNDIPVVNITENDTGICLGTSLTLNATADNPFVWNTLETTNSINVGPLNDSLFYIVATNLNCTSSDSIIVSVDTIPIISILTNDTSICLGENVDLEVFSTFPILWSTNETTNIINVTPVNDSIFIAIAQNGNCSISDSIEVLVNDIPVVNITENDTGICLGTSLTLNATADNPFVWNTLETTNSINVNPLNDSLFYIISTNLNCTSSDSIIVSVDTIPIISILTNDSSICLGENVDLEVFSTFPIQWSTNETTNIINVTPVNDSTFIAIAQNGNCSISDSVEVIVNDIPVVNITENDTGICLGTSLTLNATSDNPFVWNTLETTNSINVNPLNDSLYYIVATNLNCTSSDSIFVSTDTIPIISILTNDTSICLGENVDLEVSSSFPFIWNTNESTNITNVTPGFTTNYYAISTNGNCSINDSVLVTILALPNINILGPDTVCNNSLVNLTAIGGTSYNWTNADNLTSINNSILVQNDTIVYLRGGNICTNFDTLQIYSVDSNFVEIIGDDTICEGQNATLIANGSGEYLWNTGQTSNIITATPIMDSVFTISSGSGYCPIAFDNFEVIVNPSPIISTNGPFDVIQGETIDLFVNGASNIIWNPTTGLSCVDCENPSLIADESITYYVRGIIENCYATDSIIIVVNKLDECVAIPNAFSPNNDAVNNAFYPISRTLNNNILEFRIYNKWGENVHSGIFPWDGFYKGKEQPTDVYIYYINYQCNGEEKSLIGNVTLLR